MMEDINQIFSAACQLDSTRIVLVGVSGGPDSLCLLDLLVRAGYPVVVAHLDHSLRVESAHDAEVVRQQALTYQVDYIPGKADVMAYADELSLSVEEAARFKRYQFLFEQARKVNAQAVAVGHNADDQVETILMHLLRGSGRAGLMGMSSRLLPNAWSREIPLVRPLLGFFRSEILAYCQEHNLQPLEDTSNRDLKYFRNRLRYELLPLLETYNPRVKEAVLRTAALLQAEEHILINEENLAWSSCVQECGIGFIRLHIVRLRNLPLGLQRRLIRRAVASLRMGMQDQEFDMIEHALRFLHKPPATRQTDLALGLKLLIEDEKLWISTWEADLPHSMWPQLAPGGMVEMSFPLNQPQKLGMGSGWVLSIQPLDIHQLDMTQVTGNPNPFQAWLDGEVLDAPLELRGRLPGDRFQPLGTAQPMRLSDYMINRKMPQRARDRWPLVCMREKIAWIPGYGIHHTCRITSASYRVVHLELSRSGT